MSFLKPLTTLSVLMAFLLLTACGGEFSSVDEDTKRSDMSADEVASYCEDEDDYFENNLSDAEMEQFGCSIAAVFAAAFAGMGGEEEVDYAATCQAVYDDCLAADPEEGEEVETSCSLDAYSSSCEATAGQFADCAREQVQGIKDFNDVFDCSLFNEDGEFAEEEALDNAFSGSACEAIEELCGEEA